MITDEEIYMNHEQELVELGIEHGLHLDDDACELLEIWRDNHDMYEPETHGGNVSMKPKSIDMNNILWTLAAAFMLGAYMYVSTQDACYIYGIC